MNHKQRRRRGIILTPQGLEKLQAAKSQVEWQENSGNRYTLEDLCDRVGVLWSDRLQMLKIALVNWNG